MTDYKYFDLFTQDSTNKQVLIEYDGGTITNTELFAESMEITESLCSENELRFGSCEASIIKFKVGNVVIPLFNKWITVKMYLDGNTDTLFQIGRYKVYSDKPTADRKGREIVAYDAMYDILNTDVAKWYNTALPNEDSAMTMKAFRTSFLNYFGIEQEEIELVNDNMPIQKTIQPDEISGRDVIRAICEINGCFGHITRAGTFKYIYLDRDIQGLYPRNDLYPADDLYPRNPKSTKIGSNGTYIDAKYEDYTTRTIDKLQIRKEENDIGVIIGDTGINNYIIEDNFLVYGKSTEELTEIANNIFNKITYIIYRPFNATVKGNPCFEVGDAVRLVTRYELIESYVLQRTLKGIQALRDSFSTKGVEKYGEQVNSVHKSIIELKGKANILSRTIEETKSTIVNVEEGLKAEITQNANSITAEVERAIGQEVELAAAIKITSDSITAEVQRAENAESILKNDYESQIKQTAEKISAEISEKTQAFDKTGYDITYEEPKDPDIDVDIGKYWLNTANGNLYIGVLITPTTWTNLGQFHSATLESGESAGEQRWYLVGEGVSIYRKYGDRAGFNMTKYGGFNAEPPADDSYTIGSWWMDIDCNSASTITLEQYLADLNVSYPNDYMVLYEKTANSAKEWQLVKTLDIITLSDMQSSFTQMANSIVLKVRNDGELAEVKLVADAEDGTLFKVKANNIDLKASEAINLMSGGEINLTGKNITIKSDNFEVNSKGDMKCRKITAFSIDNQSEAKGQFSNSVDNSESMRLAKQAIDTAQKAANEAQGAANTAQSAANAAQSTATYAKDIANFAYRSIELINQWIIQMSGQLVELGKPGISGSLEDFPEYQE